MSKKKILITGITGQDGVFLTKKLLEENNNIYISGFSRNAETKEFYKKLQYLNNNLTLENLNIVNVNISNFSAVADFVNQFKPDYVYNLTGPSSVYNSLESPVNTSLEMTTNFMNLINALIQNNNYSNFFQPSSSEMFNQDTSSRLDEGSAFNPLSSYALSKFYIHKFIEILREKYEWNISNGILFNHESEFRENNYLIMKIINGAIDIKNGNKDELTIGSLEMTRDWSFAGDIVEAMQLLVEQGNNSNYVLGSGVGRSIKEIIEFVFEYFKLDWKDYVNVDKELLRTGDPTHVVSNPKKIFNDTGWKTTTSFEELLTRCIEYKEKIK